MCGLAAIGRDNLVAMNYKNDILNSNNYSDIVL